jgi:hypothetical protein
MATRPTLVEGAMAISEVPFAVTFEFLSAKYIFSLV